MDNEADKTADREAWQAKVRHYIGVGDRGEEPCFVGRTDLFELIDLMVEAACGGERDSRTAVISGAPGAGKTAFVRELKRRWKDEAVVIELLPHEMTPYDLFARTANAVGSSVQEERERRIDVKGGLKIPGVELGAGGTETTTLPGDDELTERTLGVPWELLKERFGKHMGGDRPLLLLCDEAQTLDPDKEATRAMVRSLHRGDLDETTPIPVVPVFAGLADTRKTLNDCGLTRITANNHVPVGRLAPKECKEYALKVLRHLDAEGTQRELSRWADWFVDSCDGWPKHLRCQMDAVARDMLRADTARLASLDAERIAQASSDERNTHYGERLEATDAPQHRVLFDRLASAANEPGGAPILALIKLANAYGEDEGWPLDGEAMVESAVHAGILQTSPNAPDRYVCPIPSLAKWLSGRTHVVPLPPVQSRAPQSR